LVIIVCTLIICITIASIVNNYNNTKSEIAKATQKK